MDLNSPENEQKKKKEFPGFDYNVARRRSELFDPEVDGVEWFLSAIS